MLSVYDLNPDNIKITIDWDKMVTNASVFITCINTEKAVIQCKAIFKKKRWGIEYRVIIQDGKLGVRVWRTT